MCYRQQQNDENNGRHYERRTGGEEEIVLPAAAQSQCPRSNHVGQDVDERESSTDETVSEARHCKNQRNQDDKLPRFNSTTEVSNSTDSLKKFN